jgi:uncharacterized protein YgiM (DUF1202 family)
MVSKFSAILLIFGLFVFRLAQPASAADIAIIGDTILFSGEIKAGDLSDLTKQVFKEQSTRPRPLTLSLNSNGNNFEEGILLSLFVQRSGLRTLVKAGNRCNSACAFVFLGGSTIEGGETGIQSDRNLEVGAELGFHMPFTPDTQQSVTPTEKSLNETEAIVQLGVLFDTLDIPKAIRPKLMQQDVTHSLYDATSVEAVELLEINVEGLSVVPQTITKNMAVTGCLNSFRLAMKQVPSLTADEDRSAFESISKASPIQLPNGAQSEFALIPAVRLDSGDVGICRIGSAGECQGYFHSSALANWTQGEEQIAGLNECQRQSNVSVLVPATTRLSEIDATLRRMETAEAALLTLKDTANNADNMQTPTVEGEEDAARSNGDVSEDNAEPIPLIEDETTPQEPVVVQVKQRNEVICNANQTFANVRRGPNSATYEIVSTLPNQTVVTVLGNTKNPATNHPWYEISFAGGRGFIDSELVQRSCLVASGATAPVKQEPAARKAIVCNAKGDSANLRSAPTPQQSTVLRKLFNHEPLTIIGEANNPTSGQLYFKINSEGIIGFVDSELVRQDCDLLKNLAQTAVSCNAGVGFSNMRSGPNPADFPVLRKLENNTAVEILERTANPISGKPWLRIRVSGQEGFIDAGNVASACNILKVNATAAAPILVLCNPNARFANLRAGPNKDMFDIIAEIQNNQKVRVLEKTNNPVTGHLWLKIEGGGNVGFVDSEMVATSCN